MRSVCSLIAVRSSCSAVLWGTFVLLYRIVLCVRSAVQGRLVVLSLYLEVCLRVVADGAYVGSLLSDDDVSAVGTLPDDIAVLREYALLLYIVQQPTVALLVCFFYGSDTLELLSNLGETLLAGLAGHAGIHVSPLEVLATGCSLQIAGSILDCTALQ